jgi:hypothetical protein
MNTLLKTGIADAINAYVAAVQAGAGAAAAEVAAKDKLAGAKTQVDPRWARLAMPLTQFAAEDAQHPDEQDIDLLDADGQHAAPAFGWDWSLTASAGLGLDIDVLEAGQLQGLGIEPPAGRLVVSYAVQGGLGASVKGQQVAGAWTLGATGAAAVDARIEWYVEAGSTARLGPAFIAAAPCFVPPMSLPDLFEAASTHPDFWGCSTHITGTLTAGFTAAADWAATGWTLGLNGDKPAIGLSLGVKGSASFSLGGDFRLRCIAVNRGGKFALRVKLDHQEAREKSLGLELSAGADFSALAQSAEAYLRAKLPPANAELLNKLSNPGALIQKELESGLARLFSGTELSQLAPLLAGSADASGASAALAARLAGPLADRLDRLNGAIATGAATADVLIDGLIDGFAAQAFGRVPLAADAAAAVRAFLTQALADTRAKLEDGIAELATRLDNQTQAAAGQTLEPLATLGRHIAEEIKKLGATLSQADAVVAIRTAIDRYAAFRQRIIAAFADAQRAKLTASVAVAMQEARSQQAVFQADFVDGGSPAAQRLFSALWSGHLEDFGALVDAAGPALRDVSGWLDRAVHRMNRESFTLSAFGLDFSTSQVRDVDLKLRSDLSGHVIGFAGSADAMAETNNRWVQREARLGIEVRLSDAGGPGAHGAIEFSGAFSAKGRDMSPRQFANLQRSLSVMTGQKDPVDLRRLLDTPPSDDTAFKTLWRGVNFVLPMSLQAGEFSAVCGADDALVRKTMLDCALKSMDASLNDGDGFDARARPSDLVRALAEETVDGSSTEHLLRYLDLYPRGHASLGKLAEKSETYGFGKMASSVAQPSTDAHRQLLACHRLANAVGGASDFARACRLLDAELRTAATASAKVVFDRSFQHLRAASVAMEVFAIASDTFVGNDEPVAWPLVAFSWLLCRLGRGDDAPGYTPMVVFADRPDRPVPLLG